MCLVDHEKPSLFRSNHVALPCILSSVTDVIIKAILNLMKSPEAIRSSEPNLKQVWGSWNILDHEEWL